MTADVQSAAARSKKFIPKLSDDKLEAIRDQAVIYRDLTKEKEDLEARLKETNIALTKLEFDTLPSMMDELGVPRLDLEAKGNLPAVKIESKAYYAASISAKWPEDRYRAALDWLVENGHGDLIKTSVTIPFAKEDHAKAIEFAQEMEKAGLEPVTKEAVHHGTLSSWLKEQVLKHASPPLDTIGGKVGKRIFIKEV